MGKRLITAADVRTAAQSGRQTLEVPADTCIITPMARDEAFTLGITLDDGQSDCPPQAACAQEAPAPADTLIKEVSSLMQARLPAGSLPGNLEGLVREVVVARLQPSAKLRPAAKLQPKTADAAAPVAAAVGPGPGDAQGVRIIDGQRLIEDQSSPLPVDEKMLVADAIGDAGEDRLAGGYMVWEKAAFNRQVEVPEIAVVLEGELSLKVGGKTLSGKPGDMIYFPKGAAVEYSTASRVKLACINCI